ncbi:hypothetical protein ABEB36_011084 [Hypothenemus hampei]|uniref:Transcription factor Adf-1 n=1 Tax=Hypothenemus hampei TaxID=57062 RepID=A0ABD1EE52_HYPHA
MTDKKFSVEEDNLLTDLVEENRPLYDPQNESYKDMRIRDNIWSDIGEKLQKTDEECKKRWKYIRDSYNRYKRKRKCITGSASKSKTSKWDFFERLRFLERVPIERNTESSIVTNSDSNSSMSCSTSLSQPSTSAFEQQINDKEDSQPLSEVRQPPPSRARSTRPSRRTIKHHDELLQFMKEREESRQKLIKDLSQTNNQDIDDDVTTFANHVKSVLTKLSPQLKLDAKNEIFATLSKYEKLHLDIQEERPTSTHESTTIFASTAEPIQPTIEQASQPYFLENNIYEDLFLLFLHNYSLMIMNLNKI